MYTLWVSAAHHLFSWRRFGPLILSFAYLTYSLNYRVWVSASVWFPRFWVSYWLYLLLFRPN